MNELQISKQELRDKIMLFEDKIKDLPGVMHDDCYPLKHQFAKGCYVREIAVPAGNLVVTKIHKVDHPCFIMKGVCSIITEEGVKKVKAPHYMITRAGTKRIVWVHEDTVWVTVHITDKTDLDEITFWKTYTIRN